MSLRNRYIGYALAHLAVSAAYFLIKDPEIERLHTLAKYGVIFGPPLFLLEMYVKFNEKE